MDINRLRQLAGTKVQESTGNDVSDIIEHLEGLLEQIPGMRLDDDVEEGVQSAIMAAMGQIKELAESAFMDEAYEQKYFTNQDEKYVRMLVSAHLGHLGKSQKYSKMIADYILSQELDMKQEQLEEYIEDILNGEFWYPGQRSPFRR